MKDNFKKNKKNQFNRNRDHKSGDYDNDDYDNNRYQDDDQYNNNDDGDDDYNDDEEDSERGNSAHRVNSRASYGAIGAIFVIGAIVSMFMISSDPVIDTSPLAQEALSSGISQYLAIGSLLLAADQEGMVQDPIIIHDGTAESTQIAIWDYAAEDGDYVEVWADGVLVTPAFMIKHRPLIMNIPIGSTVTIRGIRDGGGGITYAVNYGVNHTTYFNTAPLNGENTYTFVVQ
ncbi:hypothetical protein PVA45_07645 (plasmid) [Entomospira entomophila]|uniref:Uncharacterized protein n=1 Tax=Entomospira entomophila TaxID=2719988 RepID=A0A968KUA6_9SPIO|nr:hypothetical protein [Entomospira entomophilus]NIZ41266.1 hypothetical protein [Entomospira entomophilus]WDI36206.1 hypothetical protein PVA45_07645 [Entomospira entomophilus]